MLRIRLWRYRILQQHDVVDNPRQTTLLGGNYMEPELPWTPPSSNLVFGRAVLLRGSYGGDDLLIANCGNRP